MPFFMSIVYMSFGIGMLVGVFPALIRYLLPATLTIESGAMAGLGLIAGVSGAVIYFSCVFDFAARGNGTPAFWDPPKSLIQNVWFRSVRNPMYIGVGLMVASQALWFGSIWLMLYTIVVIAGFHWFVVAYEEPHLTGKYGKAYKDYCKRTSRWIPGWPGDSRKAARAQTGR